MPKLELEVSTRTEVSLKPKLLVELKKKLTEYRQKTTEAAVLRKDIAERKDGLEMLFADAGEYEALEEGVRITTPFGEVPMKIIKGQTAKKLNATKVTKLLISLGATVKQMEACYDKPKDKKPYLGVYLPDVGEEGESDE